MERFGARWNAVRFVVLAVACMMVVSITGSGGYVFLQAGSGKSLAVAVPFHDVRNRVEAGEDGTDTHGSSSVTLGMEALGDTFAPEFLPPSDGGSISPMSIHLCRSPYLPRIFRPPIA
jgi:hypothetical protein